MYSGYAVEFSNDDYKNSFNFLVTIIELDFLSPQFFGGACKGLQFTFKYSVLFCFGYLGAVLEDINGAEC